MKIDVSNLLKQVGATHKVEGSEALSFKEDDLKLSSPVRVKLKLVNTGRTVLITGLLKTTVRLGCCRCLKEFDYPINIKIEEEYSKKHFSSQNIKEGEEAELKEKDLVFEIGEDNVIDLDEAIRQNIIVALPIKPLFSKLCRGLPEAKEAKKKSMDPRLAKLKEFKNAGS